jgi:cytochrome c peroxidase
MRRLLAVVPLSLFAVPSFAQGGLPPLQVPAQNPITPQKAILGKLLFWDEQLSSNNRVACGTCHTFAAGGGDLRSAVHPGPDGAVGTPDDKFGSPGLVRSDAANQYLSDPTFGLQVQVTPRATPSFLTGAWFPSLFWDGRATSVFTDPQTGLPATTANGALESQAVGPVLSSVEMAHDARSWASVTQKLATANPLALATDLPADMAAAVANGATYPSLFAAAFGTPDVTAQRIAFALATYQRTLVPDQTPWDQFQRGVPGAMNQSQINGMNVFNGPGRCNLCHVPGLFSDRQFRNLGLRPVAEDTGRQGFTSNAADRGKFKVPSLRNAGLRTRFMHNGQFTTIGQVFGFYLNGGGPFLDNKDPLLVPLQVPPQAANDLINFVTTALTDPRVAAGTGPFTRPTLASQRIPGGGFQYGPASAGTGLRLPGILAGVPANLGNVDFKVGVDNARGGAFAALAVSPLLAATQYFGVNVNVDIWQSPALFYRSLAGAVGVAGAGYGTVGFALPAAPALTGVTLYGQWFVFDAGVASGLASSRGAELRLF